MNQEVIKPPDMEAYSATQTWVTSGKLLDLLQYSFLSKN